jgi:hypothetical protein
MGALRAEPRGEVVIASRSERPADVGEVTRRVIVPAVLELVLPSVERAAE